MQIRALLAVIEFGVLVSAQLQFNSSTHGKAQCFDYVIVSARGTGGIQGPSIASQEMISQILAAVPNGVEYDVIYPAADNQSYQFGSLDTVKFINTGLQHCPKQVYALIGYSQGASVIMGTLKKYPTASTPFYESIKSVLVMANLYHVPYSKSVNIDQTGGNSTAHYSGMYYNASDPSSRGIPNVYYTSNKLTDICYAGDIACCPDYPGASFVAHEAYITDSKMQTLAAKFVIAKLTGKDASFGYGQNATSSVSSTASATTSAKSTAAPLVTQSSSSSSTNAAAKHYRIDVLASLGYGLGTITAFALVL